MKVLALAIILIIILGALAYFFYVSKAYKPAQPAATTQVVK